MRFTLTAVSGDAFVDRKGIVEEMCFELGRRESKTGFALTGIRRVGKSSILREVGRRLLKKGVPTIYLSLWEITPFTLDQFIQTFVDKAFAEFQPYLPWKLRLTRYLQITKKGFADMLSNLKVSAKISEHLEVTFSYLKGEEEDPGSAIHHSFNLPETLAIECGKKCVVMLDEFPSIMDLSYGKRNRKIGDSIVKALRSDYENFQNTALVISGSIRKTLRAVLGPTGALWKQLLRREIQPFTEEETTEFLQKYIPSRGDIIKKAKALWQVTGGIPYNLQLVCRKLALDTKRSIEDQDIVRAVQDVLREEGRLHFREYADDLIPSEIKVLMHLASGAKSPSQISGAALMELSAVTGLLKSLMDKGYVRRVDRGTYKIIDPLFQEWLRLEKG